MLRKILLASAFAIVALTATLAFRTMSYGPPAANFPAVASPIEVDAARAAETLSAAIRIPTISHADPDRIERAAFQDFHDFLAANFPLAHATMTRETVAERSLLYTWAGTDPDLDPVLLSAHMDVAPVEEGTEADWTQPPFSGRIADGFVWGRGALDMKNALVAYMQAADALIAQGFSPARTILFAFTHDEELGAHASEEIAALLAARGVRLFFTLDEGLAIVDGIVPGVAKPVALIGAAEKGYLNIEITLRGGGGHGSLPPANPLNARLARVILAIVDNPPPADLRPPASQMFEFLAPEMGLLNRVVLANQWLLGPVLMSTLEGAAATNALVRTTFAPTIVASGVKENVMPQEARAIFNIRILPGETIDTVTERTRGLFGDEDFDLRIVGNQPSEPSRSSDVNSDAFKLLRRTIHEAFPEVVSAPGLLMGRTDSRAYQEIAENSFRFIPARLTSEDLPRIHGTNERIGVENYAEIIRFYARLMVNAGG